MSNQSFCVFCQKHYDTPRVKFFHIPKDPERQKSWSEICGIELKDCLKICEQHFAKENIVYSRSYKRHRLLKDAVPTMELINIIPEKNDHELELINEDLFDETRCVKYANLSQNVKAKNASTQTHSSKQLYSCGFLHVSKDYRVFTISCFYCKTSFTLWNYAQFIQHIKAKHRYEEDMYGHLKNLNAQTQVEYTTIEDVDMKDIIECENIEVVDYEDDFIEYDPTGYESQPETNTVNNEEVERLKGLLAKNNVIVKKFEEEDENIGLENNEGVEEIDIEASDESIVYAFIGMLKSYPILWHPPPLKLPENYLLTLLGFCKTFNEKYQLGITNSGMRNSLEKLQKWYQNNYINNNYEQLTHPQIEYFRACAEFLSDKADGSKTCEMCENVFCDYVQYMLHKKNEHDIPMSESSLPNEHVEQYLRTRWYRVQNLECQACGNKHKYINSFVVHMKAHCDVREFVCDLCGAAFVRIEGLNVHRRRHTGPIQRICKICGKGFNDFQLLGMHRRRYHRPIEGTIEEIEEQLKSRKKPTRRGVQSTKYTTRIDPKTNKRHYICHFCGKEYNQYSGLHKHFRLWHKNEWVPSVRRKRETYLTQEIDEENQYTMCDEVEEYEEMVEEVEEVEVENIETEECKIEFEFDMEPAEEIEIQ